MAPTAASRVVEAIEVRGEGEGGRVGPGAGGARGGGVGGARKAQGGGARIEEGARGFAS